ncbi:hypothetical protein K1719_018870 [Acacia pycnantha]|nr:hypothetical protein K1719_018870 [Acacia pycnantha]
MDRLEEGMEVENEIESIAVGATTNSGFIFTAGSRRKTESIAEGADHHALLVDCCYSEEKNARTFQFEANWVQHADFLQIVHVGWNEVDGVVEDRVLDLVRRLQACQKKLVLWSKSEFPNFRKAIDQLKIKLGRCYSGGMSAARLEEAEEIVKQIEEAWRNEETYWWQRSRVSWLNCGDRNTKFFHNTVIQRRQRNKILRLKDDSGRWMEDSEEINKAFSGFYSELFQTSGGRSLDQARLMSPSALITFVSAEVLEGVNLSLLSRMMSSRLSRGTFNGGLLSTEAGTLARVVADATITMSGYLGESNLLNATLLPALVISVSSIVATCYTYNSLY